MLYLSEPAREIPVVGSFDVCVLGGSCTGVFAAIRAARLGLSVVLIERMGSFGGVATLSLVNVWHSALDERFETPIWAGLSLELMKRLKTRGAATEHERNPSYAWSFNSAEMQIELDEMIREHGITAWLHTSFVAAHMEDGTLAGILIENKSGREAIRARFFIDATGDGDLCHRLGLPTYRASHRQPSTTCALFSGWESLGSRNWGDLLREHGAEFDLPPGFAWGARVPGSEVQMFAGTRVFEDCSDAQGLTRAEMEGRRQVRTVQDLLRKYAPDARLTLQALPARIGIRETRHVRCLHQMTGVEVLSGTRFDDAIANGSYRVDIHHDDKPGITLKYLDGRQVYARPGFPDQTSRWRPESRDNPTFYQIPYRALIPDSPHGNLLAAGRFVDADEQAHAAIRVMVNTNQMGEAAGTAAFLALEGARAARDVDPTKLRDLLADGGSLML